MVQQEIDPLPIQADGQLMQRVAAGQHAAWKQLVDRELTRVLTLANRLLGNQQEAEEITQESFLRLWQQAPHWRAQARIATWLYRVAHNLAIDRLRQRHRLPEEICWEEEEDRLLLPEECSPLALLEQAERRQLLETALAAIPIPCRSAVILVNMLGLRVSEAAQVMQREEKEVAALLARGRKRLRVLLAPWRNILLGE